MSLSVHVFLMGEGGERTVLDPLTVGSDLAGFESFRREVWGSDAVRALGARFFPVLAEGDLEVAPGDVAAFLRECIVLRTHLDSIAPAGSPGRSHEGYLNIISGRLRNIETTAARALEVGGGVVIS